MNTEISWIAILRDLEDFQEDTITGKDIVDGVKAIIGDLQEGSRGIVWAIAFTSSFDERTANEWLTDSSIHAAVLPLDEKTREILDPAPKDRIDLPWVTKTVSIFKTEDADQRIVTGVILQPDVPDSQGDVCDEEEITRCAHSFMADYRKQMADMGVMHKSINHGITVVESSIAPDDLTINGTSVKKGSWIVTCKVKDDKIWKQIKEGSLTAFSIGGRGQRVPID